MRFESEFWWFRCAQSNIWGVGSAVRAQWIGGDPIFVTPPQSQQGPPFRQRQANERPVFNRPSDTGTLH